MWLLVEEARWHGPQLANDMFNRTVSPEEIDQERLAC
jgi:hypothetical protein